MFGFLWDTLYIYMCIMFGVTGLNSRYYLKTNGITETLVPDELAPELVRESAVHFLQLNAVEVAIQLTLQVNIYVYIYILDIVNYIVCTYIVYTYILHSANYVCIYYVVSI